jgi:hypothetical protein
MSPAHPGAGDDLRAIAFASADGTAWGAAVSAGDGWSLAVGPAGVPCAGIALTEEPDGTWRLECQDEGLSLLAVPDEPPTPPPAEDPSAPPPPEAVFVPGAGPELCRVTGAASGRQVDWRGIRVRMAPRPAKDAPGSARFVAEWFADGSAVGLLAARPRRHDRPDHDAASATLFDLERWVTVSDPRLSTTYDEFDTPTRMNLELWVGAGEHEYPRRSAGEASGAPTAITTAKPAVQVTPLRCHSRGEEGLGVYVLATF